MIMFVTGSIDVVIINGTHSSVVRGYGLGGGGPGFNPHRVTELVRDQTMQSLWRINLSTSGAITVLMEHSSSQTKRNVLMLLSLLLFCVLLVTCSCYH